MRRLGAAGGSGLVVGLGLLALALLLGGGLVGRARRLLGPPDHGVGHDPELLGRLVLPGLDQAVGDRHWSPCSEPAGGLLGPPALLLLAPAERLPGIGVGALLLELAGAQGDAPLALAR